MLVIASSYSTAPSSVCQLVSLGQDPHLAECFEQIACYHLFFAFLFLTCILCLSPQGIGDLTLASQCFKLALAFNNDHAEAYNNLAVLELRKGHIEQVN
jgi:hypothetical protein